MFSCNLLFLLPILSSYGDRYNYKLLTPQEYHSYQHKVVYNRPTFTYRQAPTQVTYNQVPKQVTFNHKSFSQKPQQAQRTPETFVRNFQTNSVSKIRTTDIVAESQTKAANLIKILNTYSNDKRAQEFVAANFGGSPCVKSIGDAITATQAVSDLMTEASEELIPVIDTFNKLKDEKDTLVLLKGTATLLQELDVLVPKLTDFTVSSRCTPSPENAIEGLDNLSKVILGLANTTTINFNDETRNILRESADIVDASSSAVTGLRNVFQKFDKFCSTDDGETAKAVNAIGELFDEVAKLMKAFGSDVDVTSVREKNLSFARGLTANLAKIRKMGLGFVECNIAGSYKGTAEALLDVAGVLQDIGIENLEQQLGLKFNLQF